MSLISGLAIFFIIWWIALFLVLPFGVKTQAELSERRLGTMPSAPAKAMMIRKMLVTTLLASCLFGLYFWAVEVKGLGLDDLTFLPMPDSLR